MKISRKEYCYLSFIYLEISYSTNSWLWFGHIINHELGFFTQFYDFFFSCPIVVVQKHLNSIFQNSLNFFKWNYITHNIICHLRKTVLIFSHKKQKDKNDLDFSLNSYNSLQIKTCSCILSLVYWILKGGGYRLKLNRFDII